MKRMRPRDLELDPQQTVVRTITFHGHRLYPELCLLAPQTFIVGHKEEKVRVCTTLQGGPQKYGP